MADQYGRKWGLVVSSGAEGIDLSEMRITFSVEQADVDAPNTMVARVYNLSQTTSQRIQKEGQHVILQAGYEQGNFGVIFEGQIKQVKRGRLNAVTTFLDIFAADGDRAYNFAIVNKSLAAGATLEQQVREIMKPMEALDLKSTAQIPNSMGTGGTLPRGKVLFAMGRDRMDNIAASGNVSWSIQNGVMTLIEETGYLPDEAVVINAQTGMIGVPETTNNGIELTTLLNPRIKIGTRIQLDNASINQLTVREQGFPRYTDTNFPANISNDGFYRVLVAEHRGDNRDNEWYTTITALAVDSTSPAGTSVLKDG